jgi:hypothetical protein
MRIHPDLVEAFGKLDEHLANLTFQDYIKWKGFAEGKGSPYGTNNVFGAGTGILKEIK